MTPASWTIDATAEEIVAVLRECVDCLAVGDPEREHPRVEAVLKRARALLAKAAP